MSATDRAAVFARLRAWLVRANPAAASQELAPHTDIIESRILESLQVVEFILALEGMTGRAILAEQLDPESLRTLEAIYRCYFEVRS